MFDHIVLRRSEGGQPISAGMIAEALLYYQKVHIFIDRVTLLELLTKIGAAHVLTLLRRHDVSAVYCEEILGVITESFGVSKRHKFSEITIGGDRQSGELETPLKRFQYTMERQGFKKSDSRNFVNKFFDLVPVRKLSGNYFVEGGVAKAASSDLQNMEYFRQAIRQAVSLVPGGYLAQDDFKLELIDTGSGFFIFTDLDIDSINKKRAQAVPSVEPLTIAHLLSNILDARADLELSSFYGGDFMTSAITSSIIQVRHAELLRRAKLNASSRQQFMEVVLPDSPSLSEVIDSGERNFSEYLILLDRATKFKKWLREVNPDENLIRTYMRDVSSENWVQSLPVKSLRYLFTLGLDVVDSGAGLASGFADNFLVEKLLSGWRPNHFVLRRLAPFIKSQ